MQKHGYLGCFHAASARENIFGVGGIQACKKLIRCLINLNAINE